MNKCLFKVYSLLIMMCLIKINVFELIVCKCVNLSHRGMNRIPDFDDLVENNEYIRNRYLACHDRLVVILWGSFQRAIADLTQLYKGNFLIII